MGIRDFMMYQYDMQEEKNMKRTFIVRHNVTEWFSDTEFKRYLFRGEVIDLDEYNNWVAYLETCNDFYSPPSHYFQEITEPSLAEKILKRIIQSANDDFNLAQKDKWMRILDNFGSEESKFVKKLMEDMDEDLI